MVTNVAIESYIVYFFARGAYCAFGGEEYADDDALLNEVLFFFLKIDNISNIQRNETSSEVKEGVYISKTLVSESEAKHSSEMKKKKNEGLRIMGFCVPFLWEMGLTLPFLRSFFPSPASSEHATCVCDPWLW